jgi:hypothetical protein
MVKIHHTLNVPARADSVRPRLHEELPRLPWCLAGQIGAPTPAGRFLEVLCARRTKLLERGL